MNKAIFIDWNIFTHRSAYASKHNPNIPPSYTCLRMILCCLKKIEITNDDLIFICCDGRNNWRKEIDPNYKGQRNAQREASGLDWKKLWEGYNWLLKKIGDSTNWYILNIDQVESDDIMAVGVKFFENRECVLVTYDSDLEQMWLYDNVKIFSPMTKKYKIKPPNYNPYLALAKKINKEKKENLNTDVKDLEEYDKRNLLKNLIDLPDFVKELINCGIKEEMLVPKEIWWEQLPFQNSLKKEFEKLYKPQEEEK